MSMNTKPSSKFRVFLHQNTSDTSPSPASAISKASVAIPQLSTVRQFTSVDGRNMTSHSSMPANHIAEMAPSVPARKYGGAIVRVSELERAGSAPLMSANALPGETSRAPAVSWHDVGLSRSRKRQSTETSDGIKSPKRARVTPSSVGRGRASGTNQKAAKKRATTRGKRSRGANVELALQPNGRPFDFSWTTVRGRRQLRYNGKTYRGTAAHALWAKIKKAGEVSAPRVSPPHAFFSERVSRPLGEVPAPHRPSSRSTAALARVAPLLDDEVAQDAVIVLSSSEEKVDNHDEVRDHDSLSWGSGSLETPSSSGFSDAGDEVQRGDMLYSAHPQPVPHGNHQPAEGMSFLGSAAAARTQQVKRSTAAANGKLEGDFVDAKRYEDLHGLDGIAGEDVEGMFVVGDEIGGMRFAA